MPSNSNNGGSANSFAHDGRPTEARCADSEAVQGAAQDAPENLRENIAHDPARQTGSGVDQNEPERNGTGSALRQAALAASGKPLSGSDRLKLRLLLFFAALLRLLGFGGLSLLARFGAFGFWHLVPSRRKLAIESIMEHLGKNEAEATKIARQSFISNFQSFLEIVLAKRFCLFDNPRLEPLPHYFRQMMEDERPVVAVLGHLGAWELLAGFLSELRPGRPALIVVRSQKSAVINEFMRELRSSEDGGSVGHRNAAAEVTAALRAKGTAGFLVDHNTLRQEAIFLPFLGETAAVNMGPALLALRGKAVVYPLYLRRLPGNRYRMIALEPLDSTALKGGISERAAQIAQFYTGAMEEMVRDCPEQWFWMHKRWKTQPKKKD